MNVEVKKGTGFAPVAVESEVFASTWGGVAPYEREKRLESKDNALRDSVVSADDFAVFASSWEIPSPSPNPLAADASGDVAPWDERDAGADPKELDMLWDSFDAELTAWLAAGQCPHCERALSPARGRSRVTCGFCGSQFEPTPQDSLPNFAD